MTLNTENTTNRRQAGRKTLNGKQNAMPSTVVPVKRGPGRPKKAETLAREASARGTITQVTGPRRGYKECNSCHSFVPARTRKCTNCEHGFRARGTTRKSANGSDHNENIIAGPIAHVKNESAKISVTTSVTKTGRISASPGKGLKPCPNCSKYVGVRSFECSNCHYAFYRRTPSKRSAVPRPDLRQAVEMAVTEQPLALEGFADVADQNKQKARQALAMLGVKNPDSVIANVSDWSQLDAGLATVLSQEKQSVSAAVVSSRAEPGPEKDTILLHLTLQVPGQYAERYSLVKRATQ